MTDLNILHIKKFTNKHFPTKFDAIKTLQWIEKCLEYFKV